MLAVKLNCLDKHARKVQLPDHLMPLNFFLTSLALYLTLAVLYITFSSLKLAQLEHTGHCQDLVVVRLTISTAEHSKT